MADKRKYVIPGDVVTSGPFRPEQNVILEGNDIIATAVDERGKEYVAAIEANYYPVYGVQWHPELNSSSTDVKLFNTFITKSLQYLQTKI